ncbi:MAG: hypothetical protein ACT4NL_16300 [Pseudomarimonas sp.]
MSRLLDMRFIACFAAVATLLNGVVFWARRVGWLQPEVYWHAYQTRFFRSISQTGEMGPYFEMLRFGSTLHEVDRWLWLATKGIKELVWLAVLVLLLLNLRHMRLPRLLALSYLGVFVLTALSAVTAWLGGFWLAILAGCRATASWVLGAAGAALADASACRHVTRAFVWVLAVQLVLIPFEIQRGLMIYFVIIGDEYVARPVGTFNVPTSLGAFTVVTWAMAMCWGQYTRRSLILISAGAAAILIASASATGWAAAAIAAIGTAYLCMRKHHRVAILLAAAPLAIAGWLALPEVTGREDIHDSLWGRIYPVEVYAKRNVSLTEAAFGHRFGAGSNAYATLSGTPTQATTPGDHPVGDSMPAALFWQVGGVGVVLCYGLMLLAIWRSPQSRPVGIAMLVSSITLNLPEHFPLNLVLGLWLANAARAEHDLTGGIRPT